MSTEFVVNSPRLTPFLKWAGGKRWFVSAHSDIFPEKFQRYIEPFLGSGAVYFWLRPSEALLSDINADLVNAYLVVRDDWESLSAELSRHDKKHCPEYYYAVRGMKLRSPIKRAARLIYLNRTCWNGLYRVNRQGVFNVPIGSKTQVLLDSDDFSALAEQLKKATIQHGDFESAIDEAKSEDLVFVDPPYTVKHNLNGFLKYNDKIFSWQDQVRLRDAVVRASERGAYVVVTNANHKSLRDLYAGFNQSSLTRQSVLSGLTKSRGSTEELLITNF